MVTNAERRAESVTLEEEEAEEDEKDGDDNEDCRSAPRGGKPGGGRGNLLDGGVPEVDEGKISSMTSGGPASGGGPSGGRGTLLDDGVVDAPRRCCS